MNRLFVYAVILNVALLGVFILLDMITWNNVTVGLTSLIQAIHQGNGTLADIWSNHLIIQVGISVGYFPNIPYFAYAVDSVNTVNLPLIWFIVTIVVNLCMIWYSGTKRMNELTKGSRTETISSSKTEDKLEAQK